MASLGVQLRGMDSDPRSMHVAWPLAVWIWAGSPGQVGGKLLTENIQGEWVTMASTHWVPSLALIGSCVIPCDTVYSESPVVQGQLQPGAGREALPVY